MRTLVLDLPIGAEALVIAEKEELALGAAQLGRVLLGAVLALAHRGCLFGQNDNSNESA